MKTYLLHSDLASMAAACFGRMLSAACLGNRALAHCRNPPPMAPQSSNRAAASRLPLWEPNCHSRSSYRSTMSKAMLSPARWSCFAGRTACSSIPPLASLTQAGNSLRMFRWARFPGRYQLTATTTTKAGKSVELKIEEIGLGYQEILGSQLNDQYCARCHNQDSTPERVSNYDNLEMKPHPFTEGDTLNKMSDADLARDHLPRRARTKQIAAHASLRIYFVEIRNSGAHRLHSDGF